MQIKDKKEKAQSYVRIRLNKYGPNDSIVLFSGSRQSYPGIGSVFLSEPDIYQPILDVGKMVKRGDIMRGNSFTDRSLRNLAMNLCAYRYLYEKHQRQYGSISAALGYGIGEVAAATVAGIIDIKSAFGLVKRHSTMVEANESKFPSCIALIQHSKKSRVHEACRDARNFLETSCGFEFITEDDKSAMHDPITRLPTTVQIISHYSQNKAIIGGHPNGVKFILQNKKHFGITNGYLMKSPALNTYHYSHIEQRLSTHLQNIEINDPKLTVHTATTLRHVDVIPNKSNHYNSLVGMRHYTAENTRENLVMALSSAHINWYPLLREILYKNERKSNRQNLSEMPHVIDVGIGGVHAPQIVTSFGYDYVTNKYKWIDTGEPDWVKQNHKSVVTKWKPGVPDKGDLFVLMNKK